MELTNMQMEQMAESLSKHLDKRDIIGYAAARNTRILADELTEYMAFKGELMGKYGERELDSEGNPTGRSFISPKSENLGKYLAEIGDIAMAKGNPELFKVTHNAACSDRRKLVNITNKHNLCVFKVNRL